MRIVMFYHSLVSDWNHGNAHFLRGVAAELLARGHQVRVYEPADGWSLQNLLAEHGRWPVQTFRQAFPGLESTFYDPSRLDLDEALEGADLAIVHEWNELELVRRIGQHRARSGAYRLLFHDTHHRSVTDPAGIEAFGLADYDGVLAFGRAVRDIYLARGWARRAWAWHEAADTRVFRPVPGAPPEGDVVWIGNWGDEERTAELREFLLGPVKRLRLKTRAHGVRYPEAARALLADAGIECAGWLPNYRVPHVFARFRATVHIPRQPYARELSGIPTIRVFEALACGIPLVCSPWLDAEGLFSPGRDFLVARDGDEMERHLRAVLQDRDMARELALSGLRAIRARHTCAHRVDELLEIYLGLKEPASGPAPSAVTGRAAPRSRPLEDTPGPHPLSKLGASSGLRSQEEATILACFGGQPERGLGAALNCPFQLLAFSERGP